MWIAVSLVFSIAFSSNMSLYSADSILNHDFTFVPVAASLIFGIILIIPLIVWGIWIYQHREARFMDIICIYGYSLTIFIPITMLWIIPYEVTRWLMVVYATFSSSIFIFLNMKELLSEFDGWSGYLAIGVQIASHCVLGLFYKLFFFQYIHLT